MFILRKANIKTNIKTNILIVKYYMLLEMLIY